jgi:pre-rRNA-processing protein TSR4
MCLKSFPNELATKVNSVFGESHTLGRTLVVCWLTKSSSYDLKGTPLPFASDAVFDMLFPAPKAPPLPVTKADFKVVQTPKRLYAPTVPDCPVCKGKRVFECQLMPNLINVLRSTEDKDKKMSEEERRKAVELALKGGGGKGMEWGTCMVFSCEKDCRLGNDGKEIKDVWQEEKVLVQWDS